MTLNVIQWTPDEDTSQPEVIQEFQWALLRPLWEYKSHWFLLVCPPSQPVIQSPRYQPTVVILLCPAYKYWTSSLAQCFCHWIQIIHHHQPCHCLLWPSVVTQQGPDWSCNTAPICYWSSIFARRLIHVSVITYILLNIPWLSSAGRILWISLPFLRLRRALQYLLKLLPFILDF